VKDLLKAVVARAGFYYSKRQYMPRGIDWLWDLQRLSPTHGVHMALDVGANIGQTTQAIKQRFPEAAVHAFEPVRSTCDTLRRHLGDLEGVHVHQLALSDRAGSAWMTADADSPLNHLVGDSSAEPMPATERVETDTLDRFCATRQIHRVDLLKVDAEGADLRVLRGADGLFRERRVTFVFAEVGFDPDDRGHVPLAALLDHLAGAGAVPYAFYDYCRLRPPAYTEEGLGLVFANVLFVCPEALTCRA
jgi:FkbM family methyltransferase